MGTETTLFALCTLIVVIYLVDQWIHDKQWHWIPEGTPALLVGFLFGATDFLVDPESHLLLTFDSGVFMDVLLPAIIFKTGFSVKNRSFLDNFGAITVYAVVGTVINTVCIGLVIYLYLNAHAYDDGTTVAECLLFGSLISAVDPVATLAIMQGVFKTHERKSAPMVFNLVSGESIFNDAVCLVLFSAILSIMDMAEGEEVDPWVTTWQLAAYFLYAFFCSGLIGLLVGGGTSLIFKYSSLRNNSAAEITIIIMLSYTSYVLCDVINISGLIGIFVCGVVQSQYTLPNLSPYGKLFIPRMIEAFGHTAEMFVFAWLGMACFSFRGADSWDWGLITITMCMMVVVRGICVFGLTPLINLGRTTKIDVQSQVIIWFSGLRGAIAFSLAVSLFEVEGITQISNWVTTTLFVVFVTNVVFGAVTPYLLKALDMEALEDEKEADDTIFVTINQKYLKPFFALSNEQQAVLDEPDNHSWIHRPSSRSGQLPSRMSTEFMTEVLADIKEHGNLDSLREGDQEVINVVDSSSSLLDGKRA